MLTTSAVTAPEPVFTVGDLLDTPPFRDANVVAAGAAAPGRAAEWISVVEWPIEDFVQPGEVVLTTGVGCGPRRLQQLLAEVIEAGAACVCVSFDPGGEVDAVPPGALRAAEEAGVPVVVMPWKVRFSDVIRAFVDGLLSERYGGAEGGIAGAFTSALLGESGLEAVATELERMLGRPVLVLDARLEPRAESPQLRRVLGPDGLDELRDRARGLDAGQRDAARRALDSAEPQELSAVPALELGAAFAVAARARHRSLGYVVALAGDAGPGLPALGHSALAHAATAVAIEMLRSEAARRAADEVRGDALWTIARGQVADADELASLAAQLGLSTRAEYEVAVGEVGGEEAEQRTHAALELSDQLTLEERSAIVATSGPDLLVLLPAGVTGRDRLRAALAAVSGADWGIAERPALLERLPDAWEAARRALTVGRALRGPGSVGDGRSLGSFLLLHGLSEDPDAVRMAEEVLAPLVRYDEETSRDFLNTLEVFLAENGNATAAARRLYLNRHSLAYRLRKIEELTGCSLADHDDRFLLELSLRIRRL